DSQPSFCSKFGRQFATTLKPSLARDWQIAVPRPPMAPVTRAIFWDILKSFWGNFENRSHRQASSPALSSAKHAAAHQPSHGAIISTVDGTCCNAIPQKILHCG